MSKQNITLVYTSIVREKHTILSEYTEFSGNFSQILIQIMKDIIIKFENIPETCRSYFFYGKYSIFFLKYKKIYILTMFPNINLKNKEIIFAFLYSIYMSLKLKKDIDMEKMDKMKAYSLSSFSNVLSEKNKLFKTNNEIFINLIKSFQSFPEFNIQERHFESEVQLPILSKIQTHAERKIKEEQETKETDDFVMDNQSPNNKSFISFNSVLTYDSFKDDFLMNEQEKNEINLKDNNNLIENNINIDNTKNDDAKNNLIEKMEIKSNDDTNYSLVYGTETIGVKSIKEIMGRNNKCCNLSSKTISIIIIISVVLILAVVLGVIFSK
jgi:hypothetical protein